MRDTPRTDALDVELGVTDKRAGDAGRYRNLSRQLERELAECKAQLQSSGCEEHNPYA